MYGVDDQGIHTMYRVHDQGIEGEVKHTWNFVPLSLSLSLSHTYQQRAKVNRLWQRA
jgi:hypothetical protein